MMPADLCWVDTCLIINPSDLGVDREHGQQPHFAGEEPGHLGDSLKNKQFMEESIKPRPLLF